MYEKLIELLEPYMSGEPCDAESGSCELTNCRTCDAIALANRLIFHDVVPVVRCKDCIHWLNEDGMNDHVCLKIYSDGAVSPYAWQDRRPDDFCSYGERKDGEG